MLCVLRCLGFALLAAVVASPLAADEAKPAPSAASAAASAAATAAAATTKTEAAPRPARAASRFRQSKVTAQPHEAPQTVYRIECRIVERGEDGEDEVLSQPTVATLAHQPAHVQIAQQTPIVAGVESVAVGGAKPNIVVLTTGLSLVMRVAPDGRGRATFDVTIERSDVESVAVTKRDDGSARQSARVASHATRVVDSVELDKKFVVGVDHQDVAKSKRRAEFVVTEVAAK